MRHRAPLGPPQPPIRHSEAPNNKTSTTEGPGERGGGGIWLFVFFSEKKLVFFCICFLDPLRLVACGDPIYKPLNLAFFLDPFPKKIYAIGTCRGGRKKTGLNAPVAEFLWLHRAVAYAPSPQPVAGHDVLGAPWAGGARQSRRNANRAPSHITISGLDAPTASKPPGLSRRAVRTD
jgi:hypothetical protein